MKKDMLSKLEGVLASKDFDEPKVMYILVEIRKIIEQNNLYPNHPLISFYSNWVVHPLLDQSSKKYLSKIEKLFTGDRAHDSEVIVTDHLNPLINFEALRGELNSFLSSNGLTNPFSDRDTWRSFLNNLINILVDCPLVNKDPNSIVSEFIIRHQHAEDDLVFEIILRNGIQHSVTTNFPYMGV